MGSIEKLLIGVIISYSILYLLDSDVGFSSTKITGQPYPEQTDWDRILGRQNVSRIISREQLKKRGGGQILTDINHDLQTERNPLREFPSSYPR